MKNFEEACKNVHLWLNSIYYKDDETAFKNLLSLIDQFNFKMCKSDKEAELLCEYIAYSLQENAKFLWGFRYSSGHITKATIPPIEKSIAVKLFTAMQKLLVKVSSPYLVRKHNIMLEFLQKLGIRESESEMKAKDARAEKLAQQLKKKYGSAA